MSSPEMNEWYLDLAGKVIGPLDEEELAAMARKGKLRPADLLKNGAAGEWCEAQKTGALSDKLQWLRNAPSSPRDSNEDNAANSKINYVNQAKYDVLKDALRNASREWLAIRLIVNRIIQSDFQVVRATKDERSKLLLATIPISDPLAQNYSAWRRSVLTLTSFFMITNVLLSVQNFSVLPAEYGTYNRVIAFSYDATLYASLIISAILVTMAAMFWSDVAKSKKFARFSWLIMFFGPALLLAIPIERMLDLDEATTTLFSGYLTVTVLLVFLPKIIGIFPGIIRALLTLKTLLPESQAPGWAIVIFAPIYSLFFIAALSITSHFILSGILFLAVVLLALAPLTYVIQSRSLTASHDTPEASSLVRRLRRTSALFTFSGIGILLWLYAKNIGIEGVSYWSLVQVVSGLLSTVMLLTVVGADFSLAVLRTGYEQSRDFHGSKRQMQLNQKFESLTSVGLTDLAAGEAELAKAVGTRIGDAKRRGVDWAANKRSGMSLTGNEHSESDGNQYPVKRVAGGAAVIVGFLLWFGGELIQIQPYNVLGIPILFAGAVFYFRGKRTAK